MRNLPKNPAVDITGAHAAGDVVFTQALGPVNGILRSLAVLDSDNQGAAGHFLFFDGPPGVGANNAVLALNAAAQAKFLGSVPTPNFVTVDTKKFGTVANIQLGLKSNQLYMVFYTTGTPTYASAQALKLDFHIEDRNEK